MAEKCCDPDYLFSAAADNMERNRADPNDPEFRKFIDHVDRIADAAFDAAEEMALEVSGNGRTYDAAELAGGMGEAFIAAIMLVSQNDPPDKDEADAMRRLEAIATDIRAYFAAKRTERGETRQ